MVVGFAVLVAGALLLEAGISGRSLADVLRGIATANHRLKFEIPNPTDLGATAESGKNFLDSLLGSTGGATGKTPKAFIDTVIVPIAKKHGWRGNAATIRAANAVHGPTKSGGLSDHQGPGDERWAGDFGTASFRNGARGVDAFMKEVAAVVGAPTHTGLQTLEFQGLRIQLIWQTDDHYDHGHVGASGNWKNPNTGRSSATRRSPNAPGASGQVRPT